MKIESEMQNQKPGWEEAQLATEARKREDLQARPDMVLTLLEPDQVVVAKQRTRWGSRRLTRGHKVLLWGLRIYVVVMLIIVLVSVIRAIHMAH